MEDEDVDKQGPVNTEIFTNLLSCSEEYDTLKKIVQVYDETESYSGWQSVSPSAKYDETRSPASVKSDTSVNCISTKKKRNTSKLKKNEPKVEYVANKFRKHESLGVLSYTVSSWRTIVDPQTFKYIKRYHPCHGAVENSFKIKDNHGVTFLDPGSALDKHLGDFIKRQRVNTGFLKQPSSDLQSKVEERMNSLPTTNFDDTLRSFKQFRLNSISRPSSLQPQQQQQQQQDPVKKPIANKRSLSPLLTLSSKTMNTEQIGLKSLKILGNQQLRRIKSSSPITCQIVNNSMKMKQQKLKWLPITTSPPIKNHVSHHGQLWSSDLQPPPHGQNVNHYSSPRKQNFSLRKHMKPSVPCKIFELPLTSSGLN